MGYRGSCVRTRRRMSAMTMSAMGVARCLQRRPGYRRAERGGSQPDPRARRSCRALFGAHGRAGRVLAGRACGPRGERRTRTRRGPRRERRQLARPKVAYRSSPSRRASSGLSMSENSTTSMVSRHCNSSSMTTSGSLTRCRSDRTPTRTNAAAWSRSFAPHFAHSGWGSPPTVGTTEPGASQSRSKVSRRSLRRGRSHATTRAAPA